MSQSDNTFCTAKQVLCLHFSGCPIGTTPSLALQIFVQVSRTLCTEDCHLEEWHTVIDMQVSADGTYITTTDGSTVRFWDAASFNPIKEVGLSFSVEGASLNGEDKYVVGGEDMSVRQYEYASGHELDCNQKHHGPVHTGFEFREA